MAQYILKKTSIIYLCYFVILVAFDQSWYISTLLTAHKLDNSKKKKKSEYSCCSMGLSILQYNSMNNTWVCLTCNIQCEN